MRIAIQSFRGEAPRITPRALPDNAAQDATNARLQTGDLQAWKQFALTKALATTPLVETIYLLNDKWLSWPTDVDVARGTVSGDTTFRTYLTGPDQYAEPRFTNYALATTGAEPFPVATRPLGVPNPESPPLLTIGVDPNATTFSVDVLDNGNVLATSWTTSSPLGGSTFSSVTQSAGTGNGPPSYLAQYDEIHNEGEQPFAYRNFGINSAAAVRLSFDFRLAAGSDQAIFGVQADIDGKGAQVRYQGGALQIHNAAGWSPYNAALLASVGVGVLTPGLWYTLQATIARNADGTKTVIASIYLGSAQLGDVTATNTFTSGDYCGFTNGVPNDGASPFETYYDNILVQASGSTGYTPVNVATSYVYTFVNDLGQESGPSPVSATILRPDGVSVTVTTPVAVPSGVSATYGVTTKRIYRAATGATGTAFLFVAEVPLGTANYVDVLTDAQLGEPLPSALWALPPTDLRGILALPNGIMVGFSKNQLCFSAQNQPHAWPLEYRLNTDTDIVAIGNIDTTVVVGTQSFPYLATGNDPAAYSMSKLEVPQACVAKQSLAYVLDAGVMFASPDGLLAVLGNGQVRNITSSTFTREQWQALNPETIKAYSHDSIYFFFYDLGSNGRAGYALDFAPDGFGLVKLSFYATAMYADPITDKLHLVLTEVNEPADVYLPLPSTAPIPNGTTIYEFDAETGNGHLVYRWRGKLNLLDRPAAFAQAQIRAADYTNLVWRLYGDGVLIFDSRITSQSEFTLPMLNEYNTVELEFIGTSRVRTAQVVEAVEEFT